MDMRDDNGPPSVAGRLLRRALLTVDAVGGHRPDRRR
jgi:hypothetical protein